MNVISKIILGGTLVCASAISVISCGIDGGGSNGCTEAFSPSISSRPPTEAEVGQQYIYYVSAHFVCFPFVCNNFDGVELPSGARIDGFYDTITWTPPNSSANTNVRFTIKTESDSCGDSVTQRWTVHVSPDITPPFMTGYFPGDGLVNIPAASTIGAWFSEAIDHRSVTTESFFVSGPSGLISGSVQVEGSHVTFTPSATLPYSSIITVTITGAVTDLGGNVMASDYSWDFKTEAAPDINPPTSPTGLTATRITGSEVDLSWNSSMDDVAVAGYNVYRDGAYVQTVQALVSLSVLETGLSFNTQYCYAISSYDLSGNESGQTDPLCVTTLDFLPGSVATWGDYSSRSKTIPDIVPDLSEVLSISLETNEGLAATSAGTVWQFYSVPTQVPNLDSAIAVVGGLSHSLVVASDGTVWAWGYNDWGQLGDGTTSSTTTPVQMLNLSEITSVAAGVAHSLALKSDGTVWATGANFFGQLGDGTTNPRREAIRIPSLRNVTEISASYNNCLALTSDGTVWSWGGQSYSSFKSTPTKVTSIAGIKAISQGWFFSLAVKNDGTVWAWGDNRSGQLGDGTNIDRTEPVQVLGLRDVIAVAAGAYHSLALDARGTIWAWGYNGEGQLGDGTLVDTNLPVQVLGINYATAIAAGQGRSLALR